MRLSTREVNVHDRLGKSPSQVDWSLLSSSAEAWPPLLPSFSAETVEALDRFVQGFICKRIEYRCGQLSPPQYLSSFLPQWTAMAAQRTVLLEDFFAQHGTRLDEATFQRIFGAFERLQSALRDARQEGCEVGDERHDKKITFARPVAHRLIRRSRDRFSLRSVADVDESVESSTRLSCSPPPLDLSDVLSSSLQRASLSPIPYGDLFANVEEGVGDERTIALPVQDDPAEERFTCRASGVYYGDVVHASRGGEGGPSPADLDALLPCRESAEHSAAHSDLFMSRSAAQPHCAAAFVFRGPTVRSATWRRCWIRIFYYVLVPAFLLLWFGGDQLAACWAALKW